MCVCVCVCVCVSFFLSVCVYRICRLQRCKIPNKWPVYNLKPSKDTYEKNISINGNVNQI